MRKPLAHRAEAEAEGRPAFRRGRGPCGPPLPLPLEQGAGAEGAGRRRAGRNGDAEVEHLLKVLDVLLGHLDEDARVGADFVADADAGGVDVHMRELLGASLTMAGSGCIASP